MCLGAIGDAFQTVDKGLNAINPFKGITDWTTDNTLGKIPVVGKPLGQLADWGNSHPAEVGALIGAGLYGGGIAVGDAASGAGTGGAAADALGTGASASAADAGSVNLFADAVPGAGGDVGASVGGAGNAGASNWLDYAKTAAKVLGPTLLSSALQPKQPKAAAVTAMPDPLAQEQAQRQKLIDQLARRGRASTILTSASNGSLGG